MTPPNPNANGTADTEGATTNLDPQMLVQLATDVETCVQQADALRTVLGGLHEQRLRGEPVQEELTSIFHRHPALRRLTHLAVSDRLGDALAKAVEADTLNDDAHQSFDELWRAIDWIVPGYIAFKIESEEGGCYWTNADMNIEVVDGQPMVEHTFEWGVDDVHRIRAPLETLFVESVTRLNGLLAHLCHAIQQEETISPETVRVICTKREELEEILATLNEYEEQFENLDELSDDEENNKASAGQMSVPDGSFNNDANTSDSAVSSMFR
jgi:hypothetical protein